MSYFSGQGKIFLARKVNNVIVGGFRWVGNVPDFKPTFDTAKLEHKESYSGQRLLDKVITTEVTSKVTATLEDWSEENIALATRGEVATIAGGTVTGLAPEVFSAGLKAGEMFPLAHQKVSAVTIEDSTPVTPLVLVEGTDYELDADTGSVTILDPTGLIQPFKAEYTYAAGKSIAFFSEPSTEVALRFEGVNTADNNKKVLVEIYSLQLDPTKELGLISNDLAGFVLEGNALVDPTKDADDSEFGQFGRIIFID